MPDITPGRASFEQSAALPPENDPGSVRAVITRGWNAYMVQVALKQNGVTRRLVGKEVNSCPVARTVARVFAATRGVPWEKVEVVSRKPAGRSAKSPKVAVQAPREDISSMYPTGLKRLTVGPMPYSDKIEEPTSGMKRCRSGLSSSTSTAR
jgi:hypothetical protein